MAAARVMVCVKRVIDFNVKVRVKGDKSGVEKANIKHSMNPFDDIAVEEAVRLKEQGIATDVLAVSVGPTASQETLRTALAMGCDRALHISHEENDEIEPLGIAKILAKIAEKEKPGLILLGKQAIDDDANQTGQMLAGILHWPQATFASEVKINSDQKSILVKREVDAGLQNITMPLPAVVTADLRLNQPRYATLKNIMAAKKKKIESQTAASFGLDLKRRTETLQVTEPPTRKVGKMVKDVDELIDKLKNEASVI